MFSEDLTETLNSCKRIFSGRRIVQIWKSIKIGGREYSFGLCFNHPDLGCHISISGLYNSKLCKMLEIPFRPENFEIVYREQHYSKDGLPGSSTILKLRNDYHIMKYLEWTPEMLKNFIDQIRVLLVEAV